MNRIILTILNILIYHLINAQISPLGDRLELIWKQPVPNNTYESSSRPLATDKGVCLSDIHEYYLDISTGESINIFKEISDSSFLVFDSRDKVTVYNVSDGSILFAKKRSRGPYLSTHSPFFTNDSLITIVSSPKRQYKLSTYNLYTKNNIWEREINNAIVSKPIFYKDLLICITTNGIELYNRINGELITSFSTNSMILDVRVIADQLIFWSDGVYSYNLETRKIDWYFKAPNPDVKSIQLLINKTEVMFSSNSIYRIDLSTGKQVGNKVDISLHENNLLSFDSLIIGYKDFENVEIITGVNLLDTVIYQGFTSENHPPDYNHPTNMNILDRQKFYFRTLPNSNLVVGRSFNSIILLEAE